MPSRGGWRAVSCAAGSALAGCGGSGDAVGPARSPGNVESSAPARPLVFVGFDASEPLVDAMRQGKIQGLVVQNPLRMGKLSVETMVKHLEKQTVEKQISTGETLVTPREHE